jgi:hypothetical protein
LKKIIRFFFEDGSFWTIHYLTNGGSAFSKEKIEVFCDNVALQMGNYRVLIGYGRSGFKKMKLFKQDKGQKTCAKVFFDSISNSTEAPIPYKEVMESSRAPIEVANSLRSKI